MQPKQEVSSGLFPITDTKNHLFNYTGTSITKSCSEINTNHIQYLLPMGHGVDQCHELNMSWLKCLKVFAFNI